MKTQRNILIAFILNLSFCIFEFIGGIITGSVAIASDAVHDAGDAASIGVSYFLEKKSKKNMNYLNKNLKKKAIKFFFLAMEQRVLRKICLMFMQKMAELIQFKVHIVSFLFL